MSTDNRDQHDEMYEQCSIPEENMPGLCCRYDQAKAIVLDRARVQEGGVLVSEAEHRSVSIHLATKGKTEG